MGSCLASSEKVALANGVQVFRARQPHGAVQFRDQDVEHRLDTCLACRGQAPQVRAPYQHCVRTQGQCLENIAATPNAAIQQDWNPSRHGFGNVSKARTLASAPST